MRRKLRIAQLGSIWETIPPKLYGGTERVVSLLTEELVDRGHDVTLFATGDSTTKAKLVSVVPEALYRSNVSWYNITYPLLHIFEAFSNRDKFDIIHMHLNIVSDYAALAFAKLLDFPVVFTFHCGLPGVDPLNLDRNLFLKKFSDSNYVSISDSQRTIKELNYVATVYNSIDISKYEFNGTGGETLAWLGRIIPDKGPKEAIQVAIGSKTKLTLAGKIDTQSKGDKAAYIAEVQRYFRKYKKLLSFIGEIDDVGKNKLLGPARCLVNPINWKEPFGLVVAEANACGTPVVAFDNGSMKEIIKEGVNGFVVKAGDVEAMIDRVNEIKNMPVEEYMKFRENSRKYAEDHFAPSRMVEDYENVYYKILGIE